MLTFVASKLKTYFFIPMKYKFLIIFSLLFIVSTITQAQKAAEMTDKQIDQLIEQAEARNMSEAELELMAKARGFTDADIIIIKERINRRQAGIDVHTSTEESEVAREQLGEVAKRADLEDKTTEDKKTKIFGKDIFNNTKISFEPNLNMATPPNYELGPEDEISIDISGYAEASYQRKVSAEGTIRVEHFAPIYVNGLTIEQAKDKIRKTMGAGFAGLRNGTLRLDLTLTKVKTIQVTLMGEVENPGTYTLSSFATLFNALYLSGGPNKIGSFRNVQLIRDNKVYRTIDIYDFLTTGLLNDNVNLRDRDVIFIPVAESLVEIKGEVNRPYRFEMKTGESISELINYAGGFSQKAYKNRLKLTRHSDKEKDILNVNQERFKDFALKNGDILEVGAILDRFTNRVTIQGAVFRPGEYALNDSPTLSALIKNAEGLREDAYSRALLRRLNEHLDPQIISINLDSLTLGFDMTLRREDVLIIKSITETRELRTVSIGGSINIPGEYDYSENMSIGDLLVMAGGLRESGSLQRVEIARRVVSTENTGREIKIVHLNLEEPQAAAFILEPFDLVQVRQLPNYLEQNIVSITGQVNYPGEYSITHPTEKISDLIERAGGARNDAFLAGAKFYREDRQVAVDINQVLKNKNMAINLFLLPGDSLHIPIENQTVRISGEVLDPGLVAYEPGLSFKDYITQAGGLTDSASVKRAYAKYANGHVAKTKSFLGIRSYPKVETGMAIVVPQRKKDSWTQAEKVSVITGLTSVTTILLTLVRFGLVGNN